MTTLLKLIETRVLCTILFASDLNTWESFSIRTTWSSYNLFTVAITMMFLRVPEDSVHLGSLYQAFHCVCSLLYTPERNANKYSTKQTPETKRTQRIWVTNRKGNASPAAAWGALSTGHSCSWQDERDAFSRTSLLSGDGFSFGLQKLHHSSNHKDQ